MLNFEDISNLLPQIYQSFEIPVMLYKISDSEDFIFYPEVKHYQELLLPYQKTFANMNQSVHYHINELFYTVACFFNAAEGYKLIIGPVPSTLVSKSTAKSLLQTCKLPSSEWLIKEILGLPIYQQIRLFNIFSLLHQTILDKHIAPLEITNIIDKSTSISLAEKKTEEFYQRTEEQNFHTSWEFEQRYLTYIEEGNLAKLRLLLDNPINVDTGIVADDNLRQIKNLFIASITLATRAAIRGGLEPQVAYHFSDLAILEMEKLNTLQVMMEWQRTSMYELTKQVAALKTSKEVSPVVQNTLNYIATHINEPLSVAKLAQELYQNRSYLSRLFKAEMSVNLSEYILTRKIIEAKDLLRFSEKSISEISNFLAFSSQSYFQTVFKKHTGLTPVQYRNQEKSYS
ncbi:helix-turn-helix domain-containing protein [Streptococcus henryi]|uniref:helix-turn-helix domain-containing protein n=1 Tax=Streptococcus henryi TaxID=439219 RepID=UPI00036EDF80|nr:helix-turn-helix domain-containing protein [Streptococcus henryi]